MNSKSNVSSATVVILALGVGIFLNSNRYLLNKSLYVGLFPAFHPISQWKYTFQELDHDCSLIKGERAIVTGANSGIGYEASKALANCGVHVTMVCRNSNKCTAAAERVQDAVKKNDLDNEITTMIADMSSLKSVQKFSKKYLEMYEEQSLDLLFLNAGYGGRIPGDKLELSEDGIEPVFVTNYLGHHLMYRLLEPMLLRSKMARIVQTSSVVSFLTFEHKVGTSLEQLNSPDYDPTSPKYYGQSKLAQILWTKHLTRRLGDSSSVFVNAFHPGAVDTGIFNVWERRLPSGVFSFFKRANSYFLWSAAEASLTMLYLGAAKESLVNNNIRGKYFHPQAQEIINPLSLDEKLQKELWEFSDDLISNFL